MRKTLAAAFFSVLATQNASALQCTGNISVVLADQAAPTAGIVEVQEDQLTVRIPEVLGDLALTFLRKNSEITLSQPNDINGGGTFILSGSRAILNAHVDVDGQDLQLLGSYLQCQ